jgi:hypothetical protein
MADGSTWADRPRLIGSKPSSRLALPRSFHRPIDIYDIERLNPTMSLLAIADSFYIGVLDLTASTSWYIEKLGLQKVMVEMDDADGCVALGFSKKDQTAIALGPRGKPADEATPRLYASNVKKASEILRSRGVNVGDVQQDRQGTQYFEIRDLEGNLIEVSEEP